VPHSNRDMQIVQAGVITFPGSNCDRDVAVALERAGATVKRLWHADRELPRLDLIVLPGGFSYGDYLRCGAIAAKAPIMTEVVRAAEAGIAVLGICNGFQLLAEAGLVPGALLANTSLKYICREVELDVVTNASVFTSGYDRGCMIRIPIAHHEGNYVCSDDDLKKLQDEDAIAFRYRANPNGSTDDIAGVLGAGRNVMGLMPHPERAVDPITGGIDGAPLFKALIEAWG
jgi:phosphoribosylformylglycinamidine synthase subunit PurQ / glutaminase